MQKNTPPAVELNDFYKGYYILLRDNLLGKTLDIIRVVSSRESRTEIVKADGSDHWFAANIEYLVDRGDAVPFSHFTFAKIHKEAALKAAYEHISANAELVLGCYPDNLIV